MTLLARASQPRAFPQEVVDVPALSESLRGLSSFRDVESQLRDLTQDFATSFNTGNYDQAAGLFASDGELMAPHV